MGERRPCHHLASPKRAGWGGGPRGVEEDALGSEGLTGGFVSWRTGGQGRDPGVWWPQGRGHGPGSQTPRRPRPRKHPGVSDPAGTGLPLRRHCGRDVNGSDSSAPGLPLACAWEQDRTLLDRSTSWVDSSGVMVSLQVRRRLTASSEQVSSYCTSDQPIHVNTQTPAFTHNLAGFTGPRQGAPGRVLSPLLRFRRGQSEPFGAEVPGRM